VGDQSVASSSSERLDLPPVRRRAFVRRGVAVGVWFAVAAAAAAVLLRPSPKTDLYRTVPLGRRSIVRVVDATGHVAVNGRVEVRAATSGRLVQILARQGAPVKAGQRLATLDDRTQRVAVRRAQASERAAASRLAEARVVYGAALDDQHSTERLAERGLGSEQDAVNAKTAAERAAAALASAQAEESAASATVASAVLDQRSTEIVSPAEGVVLKAPETPGVTVSPAEGALFVIGASLQSLRIDALVNETDIAQVRVGQATRFEVQSHPGRVFDACVERIALEPDTTGGLVAYPVTLSASSADGVLLPGMTALVHLEVARSENVLAVHEAALRFAPEGAPPAAPRTRLWRRVGPARAEPVRIRAGLSDGAFTEVTAADGERLQAGDQIVIGLLHPDETDVVKPSVTFGKKP
jgi:HlyD family secretion protein